MDKNLLVELAVPPLVAAIVAYATYLFNWPARRREERHHASGLADAEKERYLVFIERLQAQIAQLEAGAARSDGDHKQHDGDNEKCIANLRQLARRHTLELFARRNERSDVLRAMLEMLAMLELCEQSVVGAAVAVLKELIERLQHEVPVPEIDLGD